MLNLGGVYIAQERLEEAERLCADTLGIMRSTLGDEHPYTLAAMGRLCSLYSEQRRYDEAESLLLDSYEHLQGNPEVSPEPVRKTLERIIKLYEAWDAAEPGRGYADQAAEWRAKLPSGDSDAAGNDAAHEPDSP